MLGIVRWVSWNVFLALVPVAMAYAVWWLVQTRGSRSRVLTKGLVLASGAVWLAFLPNTCYLLTEWRHFLETLDSTDLYMRWHAGREDGAMFRLVLYTLFYAGYSGIGLLTFALALRPMDRLVRGCTQRPWQWQAPFFVLMSLGVYLGLVRRYNSWDLLSRPVDVLADGLEVPYKPALFALVLAFGLFLWLAYIAIDIWIDGALLRLRAARARRDRGARSA